MLSSDESGDRREAALATPSLVVGSLGGEVGGCVVLVDISLEIASWFPCATQSLFAAVIHSRQSHTPNPNMNNVPKKTAQFSDGSWPPRT